MAFSASNVVLLPLPPARAPVALGSANVRTSAATSPPIDIAERVGLQPRGQRTADVNSVRASAGDPRRQAPLYRPAVAATNQGRASAAFIVQELTQDESEDDAESRLAALAAYGTTARRNRFAAGPVYDLDLRV